MQRIAVIGLSTFGIALVRALAEERCHVLAVDRDEVKIDSIRELADEAVIADACDRRALEALRLGDYDKVILSLGQPLDNSLLAVLHLRDLKVRHIIAKAVSEDHRRLLDHLGVEDTVFPEADMAARTARILSRRGILDVSHLGENVSILEVAPPKEMVGKTLAELNLRQQYGITVVAVRDALRNELRVNPDPVGVITDSDALLVFGKNEDIDRFVGGT